MIFTPDGDGGWIIKLEASDLRPEFQNAKQSPLEDAGIGGVLSLAPTKSNNIVLLKRWRDRMMCRFADYVARMTGCGCREDSDYDD